MLISKYEIIVNLGIFAVLWQFRRKNWPDGLLFLVYLALYSMERFLLAFTSSYQIIAFGLTQSQLVALIGLAVTLPLIVWALTRTSPSRIVPTK